MPLDAIVEGLRYYKDVISNNADGLNLQMAHLHTAFNAVAYLGVRVIGEGIRINGFMSRYKKEIALAGVLAVEVAAELVDFRFEEIRDRSYSLDMFRFTMNNITVASLYFLDKLNDLIPNYRTTSHLDRYEDLEEPAPQEDPLQ